MGDMKAVYRGRLAAPDKNRCVVQQVKRPAENSSETMPKKRSAFDDLTNAKLNTKKEPNKKPLVVNPTRKRKHALQEKTDLNQKNQSTVGGNANTLPVSLSSQSSDENSESLCLRLSQKSSSDSDENFIEQMLSRDELLKPKSQEKIKPDYDIDEEMKNDVLHVPEYAFDIFEYYKLRESNFVVKKYLDKQGEVNKAMRAILVDWMVEVQENFELNHETLYLAVKIVDLYLSQAVIKKEQLQLVGSTALFVACKFDERCPPLIDDFLYICDDAYNKRDLLNMEMSLLRILDFDLGIPSSYRFLRRYAKCAKADMELLTLGRYILELSLQEYELIDYLESEMAAASLFLAMKMKSCKRWGNTMEYYTGYTENELMPLVKKLSSMLTSQTYTAKSLKTIRTKYSHKVFFEVAKVPPLTNFDK